MKRFCSSVGGRGGREAPSTEGLRETAQAFIFGEGRNAAPAIFAPESRH